MGMITCDNCGAQYDEEADKCPYCGSDNFGKAVQEHEDIISGLNREKEHLEQLPQKAAKKGKSLVTKLLIGLIVLVIVVAAYEGISAIVNRKVSYHAKQRHSQKMETMYQEGDYAGILHYMEKKNLMYTSGYEKFSDIADMERYFERYLDPMDDDYRRWIVENKEWDSIYDVKYIMYILANCQYSQDHRYKYDEEASVTYYREKAYEYILENYGITKEDTDKLIEAAGGFDEDDYDRLRQIQENMQKMAFERLKEEQSK